MKELEAGTTSGAASGLKVPASPMANWFTWCKALSMAYAYRPDRSTPTQEGTPWTGTVLGDSGASVPPCWMANWEIEPLVLAT